MRWGFVRVISGLQARKVPQSERNAKPGRSTKGQSRILVKGKYNGIRTEYLRKLGESATGLVRMPRSEMLRDWDGFRTRSPD